MQTRKFLYGAVLVAIMASPALLRAQFQAPSAEELKMTADPKAPGAAAVILEYQESDDDKEAYQNFYERIKVLTEKGKDTGRVH